METQASKGFTLLEILIVMIIMAIVTTAATLALGGLIGKRRAESFVSETMAVIQLAEQEAVLRPAVLGLNFQTNGYQFEQFVIDQKIVSGSWKPLKNVALLQTKPLPSDVTWSLTINKKTTTDNDKGQPQIVFLPSGTITPFKLTIHYGKSASWVIEGKQSGAVTLQQSKST